MAHVLITGTSKGIGLETALVLGRAGHTVFATMRSLERGGTLRAIVEQEQLPISILQMDVDSDVSVADATSVVRAQGRLHRRPRQQRRHRTCGISRGTDAG